MADLGNWLDATFKNPFENLLHEGEQFFGEDVLGLQAQAESDAQVAKTAVATALKSKQAAIDAAVNPFVSSLAETAAAKVPVLGGLIKGEAGAVADEGTDALINGAISFFTGLLSANHVATPPAEPVA